MKSTAINQKSIVTLFNLRLNSPKQLVFAENQLDAPIILHKFIKPIPLNGREITKEDKITIDITLPMPKIIIYFIPWPTQKPIGPISHELLPQTQLPPEFDIYHDEISGPAFRAGAGGLGGFKIISLGLSNIQATSLLVIEFMQNIPASLLQIYSSSNPYESDIIDSLLDALRIFTGNEPHPYKGFYLNNNQLINNFIKWPLMGVQGPPIDLESLDTDNILQIMYQIRKIRFNSRKFRACKIINLALEYYYLSSTLSETRTQFLCLMIAFEAMFKQSKERSASAASSRIAKLLSDTKSDYKNYFQFYWNENLKSGCCQIRNKFVHGETCSLSLKMFYNLKNYIRLALLKIITIYFDSRIDNELYYDSLSDYIDERFKQLPNR